MNWRLLKYLPELNPKGMVEANDTLFLFSDSAVVALTPSGSVEPELVNPTHAIHTIAIAGNSLWIVEESNDQYRLRLAARVPKTAKADDRLFRIPGPGRLVPTDNGGVLYAQSVTPHELIRFDRDGSRYAFASLGSDGITDADTINASVFVSLSPLDLGCGYVLQMLADLRSDKRWIVVREGVTGDIYRRRQIISPLGMTQLSRQDSIIVGFRDAPGKREVILYGWRWITTQKSKT